MFNCPMEQGVYVPDSVYDLIEVLYDDSIERDPTWYKIKDMIDKPGFSITQMKEYQPDLWNWVVQSCKKYWRSRSR